jgi:hypothetical protein
MEKARWWRLAAAVWVGPPGGGGTDLKAAAQDLRAAVAR